MPIPVLRLVNLRKSETDRQQPVLLAHRPGAGKIESFTPRISNRRMVRSPLFEMAPSLCLPPVDFCSGVSPSQAAKSRPARKPSGAGTRAVIAVAAIRPMPGIVMSRRATGSALARRAISPSSSLSCSSKALSILISTCRIPRALSGTDDFGSSTSATRLSTCAGPCGTPSRRQAGIPSHENFAGIQPPCMPRTHLAHC